MTSNSTKTVKIRNVPLALWAQVHYQAVLENIDIQDFVVRAISNELRRNQP